MKKRILCISLMLYMVITLLPTSIFVVETSTESTTSNEFIISAWAEPIVKSYSYRVNMYDIAKALPETDYTQPITRVEACYALIETARVMEDAVSQELLHFSNYEYDTVEEDYFTDVVPQHRNTVTHTAMYGITSGIGDNKFGSDSFLTREQVATFLYNTAKTYIEYLSADQNVACKQTPYSCIKWNDGKIIAKCCLSDFSDASQISDWAKDGVTWAYSAGLIEGVGNGNFDPKGYCTIEQALVMCNNYLNLKGHYNGSPEEGVYEIKCFGNYFAINKNSGFSLQNFVKIKNYFHL